MTNLLIRLGQEVDKPWVKEALGNSFNLAFEENPSLKEMVEKMVILIKGSNKFRPLLYFKKFPTENVSVALECFTPQCTVGRSPFLKPKNIYNGTLHPL